MVKMHDYDILVSMCFLSKENGGRTCLPPVEDRDYTGVTGANIALLKKPFCGAQAANFLNYSRIDSAIDN
ncbi:MAG: hypothetical protein II110_09440, partial [Treponema sp.]|nr:hypothetical protein [Treponema sp.]